MKEAIFCIYAFFLLSVISKAQTVDSIRVEQAGDLIKVHYKILNSNPDQVFRVSVLCSIDGGLKSQLNSLAGDFGENIVGGRSDYMILWDVLKDVDELKSAEFFIKAELVKDLSKESEIENGPLKFWQRKYFNFQLVTDFPGQKFGIRFGYMGSFGISSQLFYGKIPLSAKYENVPSYGNSGKYLGVGLGLTMRVINNRNFKLHFIGGYRNNEMFVYNAGPPSPQLWRQGMHGPELGMVFDIRRLVTTVMVARLDPKQLEKKDKKMVIASPYKFLNLGIGLRF